ncbi:MAG: hypothetical protein HRU34_06090 [Richelia sp.]|nr:hypothetical protein [Richelia sp.]
MICYFEKLILQKYNILRSHLRSLGSKDNRGPLRRLGIRPRWPKQVWKTKKKKSRLIKISVPRSC